ncbi:MAG: hypothetical protein AB8E82_18860 [Aureispira sp.]
MFTTSRLSLFFLIVCLLFCGSLPLSTVQAEVVYQTGPPAKKISKKKKIKKRLKAKRAAFKKSKKKPDNIVLGLYLTFGLLLLLPLLVLTGGLLILLGVPTVLNIVLGMSLIGIGNITTVLAGFLTGSNEDYSTQVLFVATWIMFGINLVFLFICLFTLYGTLGFLALFTLGLLGLFSAIFLVWGIGLTIQKLRFQKASQLEDE